MSEEHLQLHTVADPGSLSGGDLKLAGEFHGECGSTSLYGGLGALPPVGSRGKAPGQGGEAALKLKSFTQLLLQFLVEIRLYFLKS